MFTFLAVNNKHETIEKNNLVSYTAFSVHKSMNLLSLAWFETDWLIMFQCHIESSKACGWASTAMIICVVDPHESEAECPT